MIARLLTHFSCHTDLLTSEAILIICISQAPHKTLAFSLLLPNVKGHKLSSTMQDAYSVYNTAFMDAISVAKVI
jgi:hypothetical protein